MKVLIVDDHPVVLKGLKQILTDLKIAESIEEVKDGNEAFKRIISGQFDFVILDISMPGLSGLDILKALKDRNEKVNVLILSMHSPAQFAIRALRLGASGYISKDSAPGELEFAIKKISSGGKYISSDIVEKLVSGNNEDNDKILHTNLSEREFQVMCLLAKGTPLKEIGEKIFISEKTVTTYRSRLLEKMKMKSNSELALYAYKNNLIE
jgi:two-component system, NarL family, invasion response regulator UvrY